MFLGLDPCGSFSIGAIMTARKETNMRQHSITDTERQAIDKKEFADFEQRRLRGTGYSLMADRDRGYGKIDEELTGGKRVEIKWRVEDSKRSPYIDVVHENKRIQVYSPKIPQGKFLFRINGEEALIDTETFRRLFRWV